MASLKALKDYFNSSKHVEYDVLTKNCHIYSSAVWMAVCCSKGDDFDEIKTLNLSRFLTGGKKVDAPG